jgi:hypothetical protein
MSCRSPSSIGRQTGRSRRGGVTASERRRPRILGRPSIWPRAIGIRYRAACIQQASTASKPFEVDQGFRPSGRRTGWPYRPPADKGHRENFARYRALVATASHQSHISAQIAKPQRATNQKSESQKSASSRSIVGAASRCRFQSGNDTQFPDRRNVGSEQPSKRKPDKGVVSGHSPGRLNDVALVASASAALVCYPNHRIETCDCAPMIWFFAPHICAGLKAAGISAGIFSDQSSRRDM